MKANSRSNPSPAPAALSSSSGGGSGPYYWAPPEASAPAPPNPHGRLVILKQNSLSEDKFVRNGEPCNVKIVVKNSPFIIQVGYEPTTHPPVHVDLKSLVYDARLIYDTPDEKEVDFIKLKPLETKISVNEPGTFMNCEARLKVLTSQLEDSFFKIRFRAYDARTKKDTGLMVLSHSIKTVSKPDKLRKKKKLGEELMSSPSAASTMRTGGVKMEASSVALLNNPVAVLAAAAMSTVGTARSFTGPLVTPLESPTAKRKRSAAKNNGADNDYSDGEGVDTDALTAAALGGAPLLDVMMRVEQNQSTANALLHRIASALGVPPTASSGGPLLTAGLLQSTAGTTVDSEEGGDDESLSSFTPLKLGVSGRSASATSDVLSTAVAHSNSGAGGDGHTGAPGGTGADTGPSDKEPDLDACFSMLLQSLEALPPGPVRADKVKSVVRTLSITRTAASELHDLFWAEGLGRALGNDDPRSSNMMSGGLPDSHSILGPSDSNDVLRGGCDCAECPAKKELERVENFYREVFSMTT